MGRSTASGIVRQIVGEGEQDFHNPILVPGEAVDEDSPRLRAKGAIRNSAPSIQSLA